MAGDMKFSSASGDLDEAQWRALKSAAREQSRTASAFLRNIIRYPSIQGSESGVQRYLQNAFASLGYDVRLPAISESIRHDPAYTDSACTIPYKGRPNLVIRVKGQGNGRSIILNTHSDVVPAGTWPDAFQPLVVGDVVRGRGACDAKGQIAAIYLLLLALKSSRIKLKGDIIVQIVIEEEVGGNGSLALIRDGIRADGVIVMEPTGLNLHPANRGALWFRGLIEGRSVHMGRKQEGVSALEEALKVMAELKRYEQYLLRKARNHPMFRKQTCPAQVNIGTMQAGDWPATVPGRAIIQGGIGFPPNVGLTAVKQALRVILKKHSGQWVENHHRLEFPGLHNDAYEIPVTHPLLLALQKAGRMIGHNPGVCGMTASCDARLFKHIGKMPTVVFGAGNLKDAHSGREQIRLAEIVRCAEILGVFLVQWCDLAEAACSASQKCHRPAMTQASYAQRVTRVLTEQSN